jgi:hypothetical protein
VSYSLKYAQGKITLSRGGLFLQITWIFFWFSPSSLLTMIMYPCWKRKLCYSLRSKLIDSTLNCREYLKTWVLQYLRMKLAISSSLEPNYTRFYQKFYQNELNHHYPFFGSWNLTMLIWW